MSLCCCLSVLLKLCLSLYCTCTVSSCCLKSENIETYSAYQTSLGGSAYFFSSVLVEQVLRESGCFDLFYHVSTISASSSRCDPVPLI